MVIVRNFKSPNGHWYIFSVKYFLGASFKTTFFSTKTAHPFNNCNCKISTDSPEFRFWAYV